MSDFTEAFNRVQLGLAGNAGDAADAFEHFEAEQACQRMRMALAEVGWIHGVHGDIEPHKHDGDDEWRCCLVGPEIYLPTREQHWRARETADVASPLCFRHFDEASASGPCCATVRFMKDCGS